MEIFFALLFILVPLEASNRQNDWLTKAQGFSPSSRPAAFSVYLQDAQIPDMYLVVPLVRQSH